MKNVARILVLLVALEHIGILILEMFFWNHPLGQRIFGMTPEVSASSAVLAANQGLYNGFLAAGLLWGLANDRRELQIFFLLCVVAAGVFGGLTAKTSILLTQAFPAALALIAVWRSLILKMSVLRKSILRTNKKSTPGVLFLHQPYSELI